MTKYAVYLLFLLAFTGLIGCERESLLDDLQLQNSPYDEYPEVASFATISNVEATNYGNVSDLKISVVFDFDRSLFHPGNSLSIVCNGFPFGYMYGGTVIADEMPKTATFEGRLVPHIGGKAGITCYLRDKDSKLIGSDRVEIELPYIE